MVSKNKESIIVSDTTIRRATPEDAAGIANAHLNSWREAYRGMIPQDYLDSLPLTFKGRMEFWAEFATVDKGALYVAEAKPGIVGFAGFRHSKEEEFKEHGEVGAIYLLEKFKNKGIGAALLTMGMQQIVRWNLSKHIAGS